MTYVVAIAPSGYLTAKLLVTVNPDAAAHLLKPMAEDLAYRKYGANWQQFCELTPRRHPNWKPRRRAGRKKIIRDEVPPKNRRKGYYTAYRNKRYREWKCMRCSATLPNKKHKHCPECREKQRLLTAARREAQQHHD